MLKRGRVEKRPARASGKPPRRVPGSTPRDPRFVRSRDANKRGAKPWTARLAMAARVAAISTLLLGGGWYGHHLLTSSDVFAVRHLRVIGASRLSTGEIEALLDGLRGRNIVTTPLDRWRARLLASPWVRDVSLRRALPGTIEIRLVERVPMAVAQAGDVLLLVDEDGTVVDEFGPRYASLDLPIVEGLVGPDEDAPQPERVAVLAAALRSLNDAGLLGRVSQIDVSQPRNVGMLLGDNAVLLQVGYEHFGERVQAYLDMQARLARMVEDVESVDLRFDNRVYVRPRKTGVTFASMPVAPDQGDTEEALAEPEDGDEQD